MKSRLLNIFSYIESGLIERTVPVRLSLLAALSGEHILLLGPPGTAKSEMARKLCYVFSRINYFERLLTRFSVPEELFGPLSIKALEEDRYHRLTKSYLPDASIAFIDEIFKANSAILNSLLTLLNEREFDNGSERQKTPLISVVAASNELPEDDGLDALFDRFLFRYQLIPVSDAGFDSLLALSTESKVDLPEQEKLSLTEIENIKSNALSVKLDNDAHEIFHKLREYLADQSVYISDRRWRKALNILQVSASTNDRCEINRWDCVLLAHLMWQTPDQFEDLTNWFKDELNLDVQASVKRIEKLVLVWEQQLLDDAQKFIQKTNMRGEKLYLTPEGETTTQYEQVSLAERGGEVLFLAPPDQKDRTNNANGYTLAELETMFFDDNYKQTHIDGRWIDIQNYINNTQNILVNRIDFEPLVEDFYFSDEYVKNQYVELSGIVNDINTLCENYNQIQSELLDVKNNHIWLAGSLLETAYLNINEMLPVLVDYNQRFGKLLDINSSLKIHQNKNTEINKS